MTHDRDETTGVRILRQSDDDPSTSARRSTASSSINRSFRPAASQFVINNDGHVGHSFDLIGIKAGTILPPGGTESWAVQLSRRLEELQVLTCPTTQGLGMSGALTVT